MRLSANLDGAYPPAVARQHAMTDDVAALVIVIGIVVVIGVGPKANSDEPTTMKSAVEPVGTAAETAMDAGTAEAASAATHDSVTAHAATAHAATAMTATATANAAVG